MTRAGRILGAMMAMGGGQHAVPMGPRPHRPGYARWCATQGFGARLAGDTSPTTQERAEAKRARRGAKRRRDAELTRLGHEARGAWAILATHWRRDHERGRMWLLKRTSLLTQMRAIRRGEVQL